MPSPQADPNPVDLGQRLRTARVKAGITQEAAADRLQIARTTVVAMEKGQRRVRPEELRELARLYRTSVNLLVRPTAVHVDLTPRFRALGTAKDEGLTRATELLNALAAAEVELERLLGQPLRPQYPPERPVLPGDLAPQAEDLALEMRHRLGLGLGAVEDMVTLLEMELGVRVFVWPLEGRISGLFAHHDEVGAAILINRNHPPQRRAFTAAHEFGHLLTARREADVLLRDEPMESREERFANAFAGAFLMPAAALRKRFAEYKAGEGKFTPRHLILMAHAFRVSPKAMGRRLEDLKLIPQGTWNALKDRGFSGQQVREVLGDQRAETGPAPISPRLGWLVAGVYEKGLLSEGQLARMLSLDRVEVRAIVQAFGSDEDETGDAEAAE